MWKPKTIAGVTYDLSHLDPFEMELVIAAKNGKPEQRYRIQVIFGLHCFTTNIGTGETCPAEWAYSDDRGEIRRFDVARHTLCHRLPGIVRDLARRNCFHTGYKNYFTIELVDDAGVAAEYTVYFSLKRDGNRRLVLRVESAYVQGIIPRAKAARKPIRFDILVYNVWTNRPVRVPR